MLWLWGGLFFYLPFSIIFSSLRTIAPGVMDYPESCTIHSMDYLACSPEMMPSAGHTPSFSPPKPDTIHPPDLVFPYFNRIPPEIRAIIWEEHFLASIDGRPQIHFLMAEKPPRSYNCTFPQCKGTSYYLLEFLEGHSKEQQ